eukprot:CAMPEP_0118927630 /NCGR_PEP_ID=MMETSP1169-20130426/5060_1 /TAXON_ID=36882 /ORGANISM="Pyramimonas obovata, Strain CCMP722" /LENGTH=422 /DNA_ID=CAMNT_0006869435 /DNA_START=37 /DNA_END=1305 /DNA_ORIENTATION=-
MATTSTLRVATFRQPFVVGCRKGCSEVAQLGAPVRKPLGQTALKCAQLRGSVSKELSNAHLQAQWARKHRSHLVRSMAYSAGSGDKAQVVFLGTPEVAAGVLDRLLTAAEAEDSTFEVAAVVSQPGKPRGRGRVKGEAPPSPVADLAAKRGVPVENILTPFKAREEAFLERMEAIAPDLCITAAYGNMLPTRFLDIPKHGTLNIHPSLLPKFRGAAPVPRALEAGVEETGVSVAYTVLACDAGPILASERMAPGDEIQAPELLQELFERGTNLLLAELPGALDGSGAAKAVAQDENEVVHADKMSPEEALLDFGHPGGARALHNKVRGFAGWPGTKVDLVIENKKGVKETINVKVVETCVGKGPRADGQDRMAITLVDKKRLQVECDDGSLLEILKLQPPGKKVQEAFAFFNGLQGRPVWRT